MTHNRIKPRLLACAVAAALGAAAATAGAAPVISLTALANELGSAPGGAVDIIGAFASGGDFFYTSPGGSPGSLFYHTYGFPSGPLTWFGARVSGEGSFYGRTSASFQDSFTNSGSGQQAVTFTFNVDSGQAGVSGSGEGFADLLLRLNFTIGAGPAETVWSSHSRVDDPADPGAPTCNVTETGGLAAYMACAGGSGAFGNGGQYSVTRLLDAGQTLTVNYDIIAEVAGDFAMGSATEQHCSGPSYGNEGDGGGGDNGGENIALNVIQEGPGYGGCTFYNAITRSGDPNDFFAPANFRFSVPAPGTAALLGVAFGAFFAARRRKRA